LRQETGHHPRNDFEARYEKIEPEKQTDTIETKGFQKKDTSGEEIKTGIGLLHIPYSSSGIDASIQN
jgi:hypothetical protein